MGCPPATLETHGVTRAVLLQHIEEGAALTGGELACVRAGQSANGARCASKLLVTSDPYPSPNPNPTLTLTLTLTLPLTSPLPLAVGPSPHTHPYP